LRFAQQIKIIEINDSDLAVDIYRAAYGFAEASSDATNIGSGAILQL
jgi:hypothetical protein